MNIKRANFEAAILYHNPHLLRERCASHWTCAYTTIASDMMALFARMAGREVFFLTGTDEHGQKIQKAAQAEGTEPQAFVDRVSERFQALTLLFHH